MPGLNPGFMDISSETLYRVKFIKNYVLTLFVIENPIQHLMSRIFHDIFFELGNSITVYLNNFIEYGGGLSQALDNGIGNNWNFEVEEGSKETGEDGEGTSPEDDTNKIDDNPS